MKEKNKGFTLVEMVVVISIFAISRNYTLITDCVNGTFFESNSSYISGSLF